MDLVDIHVKTVWRKNVFDCSLEVFNFISVLLFDVSCTPLMSVAVHAPNNGNEWTESRIFFVLFLILHIYNILFTIVFMNKKSINKIKT
jgi:hypothetical protein